MEYSTTWQLSDGGTVTEQINSARFEELRGAREGLIAALDIEENFNGLLDRYINFQKELVEAVLNMSVRNLGDWAHFREVSQRLNREVVCLLSSARQYIDQTKHCFTNLPLPVDELLAWFSEEYDGRPGYRACEAIRNSSQHRSLPTQSITFGGQWLDDRRIRQHVGQLFVVPKIIRESDPDFKKSILEELDKIGEEVDLVPLLRDYLNGLASVHSRVRKALKPLVKAWTTELRGLLELKSGAVYCEVLAIENDVATTRIPVFPAIVERLDHLQVINSAGPRTFDYEVMV